MGQDRLIKTPLEFQQERLTAAKVLELEQRVRALEKAANATTGLLDRLLRISIQALGNSNILTAVLLNHGTVTSDELKAENARVQARMDAFIKTGHVPEDALTHATDQPQTPTQPQSTDGGHTGNAADGTGNSRGADPSV